MTIVAARRYGHGQPVEEIVIDGVPRVGAPDRCFDWIGVADPTAAEMELLRQQFGLHPLAVEDALNPNQLSKVEAYGGQLFIVARTAAIEDGERIVYGQTALFLDRHFIVTVRFGSTRAHRALRERLEQDAERLAEGVDFVAHAILDFIVDGYEPIIEQFDSAVQQLEEQAIDSFPDPDAIRRIFHLRRQLRRFEHIVWPMEALCEMLVSNDLPAIDARTRVWFRDIADHVRRAVARARGLADTLANIVETASLLEQHRQGAMTRQLAAWAAILAVPTAVAGIYGMNFEYMPELAWRYGYYGVLGAIGAVCGGLWLRFKQIDWL